MKKKPKAAGKPVLSPALMAANEAHIVEADLAAIRRTPLVRLLDKREVQAIVGGVSFPTIWQWMRNGRFPRSRIVGGKSMWVSTEIEHWLATLPLRPLKGDADNTGAAA